MFVGRENELKRLQKAYQKNSFQFPVIYGRRWVGKTTLINAFARGRRPFIMLRYSLPQKKTWRFYPCKFYLF
jgi:AAA+ ATPase superfamily predicted ATPase